MLVCKIGGEAVFTISGVEAALRGLDRSVAEPLSSPLQVVAMSDSDDLCCKLSALRLDMMDCADGWLDAQRSVFGLLE